jgi:hypothetical protein
MEMDDHSGRFFNSYDPKTGSRLETPDVVYDPGEALLALTRLSEHFPRGPYLEVATRAAGYLVHQRDGDIPRLGSVPREDHWLTIALSETVPIGRRGGLRDGRLSPGQVDDRQPVHAADGQPERIGGACRTSGPISYTSTATKGEAIVAAWGLATPSGRTGWDPSDVVGCAAQRPVSDARAVHGAEHRTVPRSDRAVGGWGASTDDPSIRIDYVQHNMSALVGLTHLTLDGDLPVARAEAASRGGRVVPT